MSLIHPEHPFLRLSSFLQFQTTGIWCQGGSIFERRNQIYQVRRSLHIVLRTGEYRKWIEANYNEMKRM